MAPGSLQATNVSHLAVRRRREEAHVREDGGWDVALDAALEAVALGALLLAQPPHLLRQVARPLRVQLRKGFPVLFMWFHSG